MRFTLPVVFLKDNCQFSSSPSVWEHRDPILQRRSESALLDYLPTLTLPVWGGGGDRLNVGTHLPVNCFNLTPSSSNV